MQKIFTILFVTAFLSATTSAEPTAAEQPTCDETLEACHLYVVELEEEKDASEKLLQAQAEKIDQLEKDKQPWFFFCQDKVSCTLFGLLVGAVAWELAR